MVAGHTREMSASLQVEACSCYRALISSATGPISIDSSSDPDLGGKLLYAGELDTRSRAMVIAGNIAGCATLTVTSEPKKQEQSARDGIVDFLVTSLDEALRILKNEIRKKSSVAVCVTAGRDAIEQEMLERGVLPDLVLGGSQDKPRLAPRFGEGVREILYAELDAGLVSLVWRVAQAPMHWMPKLDAIALDCLASDRWARRWLRLSPRFCGRAAQAERAINCEFETANEIVGRFGEAINQNTIGVEISLSLIKCDETMPLLLSPPAAG